MIFKNNSGFTLIEVLLALAIASSLLASIYILQAGSLAAVLRFSNNFVRIDQAKNFLFDTRRKREQAKHPKQFKLEKKEDNPEAYLKYNFGSVEQTSLKSLENIYIEKVDVMQDARQKEPSMTLLTLVYQPENV